MSDEFSEDDFIKLLEEGEKKFGKFIDHGNGLYTFTAGTESPWSVTMNEDGLKRMQEKMVELANKK